VKSGAIVNRRELLDMSDPNRIPATNAHHPGSVLSKTRTDFGVEASSRSTHFCGTVKQRSKRYPTSLQMTLGLMRDALLRGVTGPFWL
jgi:hypothetical protein